MWTAQHRQELKRFHAAFGLPSLSGDAARAWTQSLAEHFAYVFNRPAETGLPSVVWGTKRGDPGRPRSTDVICTRTPFIGYDVILNQGLAHQSIILDPDPLDLTGQVFIPVTAKNHLGVVDPPAPPPPPVHVCPPCPPVPPTFPYVDESGADGRLFLSLVKQAYRDAGRTFPHANDAEAYWHFARLGYDCRSMPAADAITKRIAELRAQLGV